MILNYPNGHGALNELCQLKDKNFTPAKAEWYQYIELSHVDSSGNINATEKLLGETLPSRARRQANTGDVLIASIEGSLANCAIVSKDFHNGLCSTGFYVISSTLINSETLLILFKSPLMQNLLKKCCSGTILTAINKSDFLSIPIPKINSEAQTAISDLVQESFKLKSESEKLLALAKQAVEVAIEQSEEEAMKLFKSL